MLVHELLEVSVERHADRVALIDGDAELRYIDLDTAARRTASVLVDCGVRPGDRVALLAANSAFFVASYHGILRAGAVVVPLSSASRADELTFSLADCGCTALLLGTSCERSFRPALERGTGVQTIVTEAASRLVDLADAADVRVVDVSTSGTPDAVGLAGDIDVDDLASIVYTSGSTGRPRGVMLSHANIVANTRSIVSYMELTERDRVLAILPFSYVFGMSLLNTHLAVGGSVVIENQFMYPTTALDTLQRTECTGLPGVPSTFQILLDSTDLADRHLPALRYACQAGGAMSPATTRRLMSALDHSDIYVMYGCTEATARLAFLPPHDLADHVGSVGMAIPGVEIDVVHDDGSLADAGEVGELVARGANIMQGYWGDPVATAAAIDEHGLHTGDLGVVDADGYLTIVGRTDGMIKSGGHRISPHEIEAVISELAEIVQVAVIGQPDDLLGEEIVAVVVPSVLGSATPDDLDDIVRAHAAENLARHKVPSRVVVQSTLPMSAAGKVLRMTLRDEL